MSRHLFRLLAALLVPVVYLLAMGPLWGLAMGDPQRWGGTAIMLYAPAVRIAEQHPAFDHCISAYVEQWYPKGVSHYGSITMKQVGRGPGVTP